MKMKEISWEIFNYWAFSKFPPIKIFFGNLVFFEERKDFESFIKK